MKVKLFALGNVVMKDDGIAIKIANLMEAELTGMGIEVIYGETDIGYCLSQLTSEDYLILMDASCLGKQAGRITILSLQESLWYHFGTNQHDLNFIHLLQCYYPCQDGIIIAIEAQDAGVGLELSSCLQDQLPEISEEVRIIITDTIRRKFNRIK